MKLFVASVYFIVVVLSGFTFNAQTRLQLNQPGDSELNNTSGFFVGTNGLSEIINFALNKETNQNVFQRDFPFGNKFRLDNLLIRKFAELTKKNEITEYLYVATCKIIRFEGPDIIHPFNYFW